MTDEDSSSHSLSSHCLNVSKMLREIIEMYGIFSFIYIYFLQLLKGKFLIINKTNLQEKSHCW